MRIVSLLPSATEMVSALGLADQLVGVSHRCEGPQDLQDLPRITRSVLTTERTAAEISATVRRYREAGLPLYQLDVEQMRLLAPDVVLTQDVCEVCAVTADQAFEVTALTAQAAQVVVIQARRLDDILRNLELLGAELGVHERGRRLAGRLRGRLAEIEAALASQPLRRVFAVEWLDPLKCTGGWLPDLIAAARAESLLTEPGAKVRPIDWQEVQDAAPDALLVMPCGWPLAKVVEHARSLAQRPGWRDLPAVQAGRVYLVDGCICSRHGPRVVEAVEMLARLLHPGVLPGDVDPALAVSWQQAYGEAP